MIGGKDSYALITGASSGFGYEYARMFARDGKNIVVLARSRDKLEGLARELEKQHGTKVVVLARDLSDPKAPQEVFSELQQAGIVVDVLVNNAGFAVCHQFAESDWQREAEMLQVNVVALTQMTKLFLGPMLRRKSGRIMNISSIVGWAPMPWWSVYAASKAYVLSFTEAVARETRGTGVHVICFCPTLTPTQFFQKSGGDTCAAYRRRFLFMDADKAARLGYRALASGKTCSIAGLQPNLVAFFMTRFLPRSAAIEINTALSRPA